MLVGLSLVVVATGFSPSAPSGTLTRPSAARPLIAASAVTSAQSTRSVLVPADAYHAFATAGVNNAKMSTLKILHQSIMAGMYIGIGGLLSLTISGALGGISAANPGVARFTFAALFPTNLLLIHMSGGQLFTGNAGMVSAAACEGRVSLREVARSWALSCAGNVFGCGLFALATAYTGLLSGTTAAAAAALVGPKCAAAFGPTLVKAIICNWLVCMAMFIATAASDLSGKMVRRDRAETGTRSGRDRVLARRWASGSRSPPSCASAPSTRSPTCSCCRSASWPRRRSLSARRATPRTHAARTADASCARAGSQALMKNMVPVCLGNAIAGVVLVAMSYSYAFGKLGGSPRA